VRLAAVAAISISVVACGPADREISKVDGVRAAYGEAQKHRKLKPEEMLRRAETSFSPVAFGTQYDELSGLGLRMIDFGVCRQNKVCTWIDNQGVQHEADDERGVDSKTIEVGENSVQSLNVLGIGRARSRPDVVKAVERFLPNIKLECGQAPPDDEGFWCGALVGSGLIDLRFDDQDRLALALVEARVPQ
jgi:hypothetical protein